MKRQLVEEWITRGKQDFEVAKILITKGAYFETGFFHIQQAIEKYLKVFLFIKVGN